MRVARWFTVLWGAVAVGFALFASFAENLIQAVNIVGSVFYGVVLGLFLVAFFLRRVGGTAVFWAAIAEALVFVLYFSLNISYLWYNLIGCAACVALSLALQAILAARAAPEARADMSATPVIASASSRAASSRGASSSPRSGRRGDCRPRSAASIVYFCHDSDHDPRETRTILRHRKTGEPAQLNFAFDEQAPAQVLAALPQAHRRRLARADRSGSSRTTSTIPPIELFRKTSAATVADFCLEMYRGMGLLDGMRRRALERPGLPAARVQRGRLLRGRAVRGRDRARAHARRRARICTRAAIRS